MTVTSHRIFNLSAAIALSFHWWVWLLFLLAASLPDRLEPPMRKRSRVRSHRGLFHTYSVWILLGLTILWLPTVPLAVSGIPGSIWLECCAICWRTPEVVKGVPSYCRATAVNWDTAAATGIPVGYRSIGIARENSLRRSVSSCSVVSARRSRPGGGRTIWILLN
jgi:hypothetical protein